MTPPERVPRIDARRYLRLLLFLVRVFVHAAFWDLLLLKPPLSLLRRPPLPRWVRVTGRFRRLAAELGGLWIKLGQFLSTRVDILPPAITEELRGLQDEVRPVPWPAIAAQIAEDFGRPADQVFARLDPEPIGAASLAQVHRARLVGGEEVVVKVLRPEIDVLVETDLRALGHVIRGLKLWGFIRRRVDVDRLADEFVTTTRRELDMEAEGRHAERFSADFADDDGVHIPRVWWATSAARTLTLEDVGYIKISDLPALEAAGIDRRAVAARLFDIYLRQIFRHNFVHADPHPGNLFVEPLPGSPDEGPAGDGDVATAGFRIAFVDFGMVTQAPERLREALREYVIALVTRDAHRMVRAYQQAGVLLPGADLKRLEEVHEALFERFAGLKMSEMRDKAFDSALPMLAEYRDLLLEMPFQAQVELVFVQRAAEILIGLVTYLDPDFDLWAAARPFALALAREGRPFARGEILSELLEQVRTAFALPQRADRVLAAAEKGHLSVESTLGPDARRAAQRLERALTRLGWIVTGTGLGVAGTVLWATESAPRGGLGMLIAAAVVWLIGWTRRL